MNIRFQRLVDRWVGVPLCRLCSLLPGARDPAAGAAAPQRILVIILSEMGSIVLAAPLFRELERNYPGASLFALLFERNRELLELLEVVPPENVLTLDDATPRRFFGDAVRALRTLRRRRIDTVIDGELFVRSSSLMAYLSGAAVRVGFHRHTQEGLYRGDFINRPVLYNPHRHLAHQFLTLAAAVESGTRPAGKRTVPPELPAPPRVAFGTEAIGAMERRFRGDFPGIDPARLVLIQPGGGALPIRAWPAEHYVRLATALTEGEGAVAVVGPASDRGLARSIVAAVGSPRCIDLTGYTRTVRELLLLFHLAPLLVANDGGPAQFSSLTPIAAVILYGPETPVLYGSLNPRAVHLHRPLSCSPCLTAYNHRNTPCDGDNRCLKEISPELVLGEARALLRAGRERP